MLPRLRAGVSGVGARGRTIAAVGVALVIVALIAGVGYVVRGKPAARRLGLFTGASAVPSVAPTESPSTVSDSPSVRPIPSRSSSPGPYGSAASPPPDPHCRADEVRATINVDRGADGAYRTGEKVVFLMRLTNIGVRTCDIDGAVLVDIRDAAGRNVATHPPGVSVYQPPYQGPHHRFLGAGQFVDENDCAWDTSQYYGTQGGSRSAPAGRYSASGNWSYPQAKSGPVYFNVTSAGPTPSPTSSPLPLPHTAGRDLNYS